MNSVIVLTIFVVTAIALITIVLLQQSKGAGMGASFGSGASGTVFGSKGAGSFLYKLTCVLALVFFISSLGIVYLQNKEAEGIDVYNQASSPQQAIPTTTKEVSAGSAKTIDQQSDDSEKGSSPAKNSIPTD